MKHFVIGIQASPGPTFNELRTRTGYSGHVGYIDAYTVGLWNDNRSFISYEIKISRSDFKSDIDSFSLKQAAAIRNSTQFFLCLSSWIN